MGAATGRLRARARARRPVPATARAACSTGCETARSDAACVPSRSALDDRRTPVPPAGHAAGVQATARASAPPPDGSRLPSRSTKPRPKELLEVSATGGRHDPALHPVAVDDDDRRHVFDSEPLDEIGPALDRDTHEVERSVVVPTLQHLGEEALGSSAAAGPRRVEEDESRSRGRLRGMLREKRHAHGVSVPARL